MLPSILPSKKRFKHRIGSKLIYLLRLIQSRLLIEMKHQSFGKNAMFVEILIH